MVYFKKGEIKDLPFCSIKANLQKCRGAKQLGPKFKDNHATESKKERAEHFC